MSHIFFSKLSLPQSIELAASIQEVMDSILAVAASFALWLDWYQYDVTD